jgi:hypothetical protein
MSKIRVSKVEIHLDMDNDAFAGPTAEVFGTGGPVAYALVRARDAVGKLALEPPRKPEPMEERVLDVYGNTCGRVLVDYEWEYRATEDQDPTGQGGPCPDCDGLPCQEGGGRFVCQDCGHQWGDGS